VAASAQLHGWFPRRSVHERNRGLDSARALVREEEKLLGAKAAGDQSSVV
jgi:hypothetical protein